MLFGGFNVKGRIFIKNPGILTTIQDLGRYGHQKDGIPPSGAMDAYAFQVANILVGNVRNTPAVEITFPGLSLEFDMKCDAAIAGADLGAVLNGVEMGSWKSFRVNPGDTLKFTGRKNGCRAYLAFAGGIDVPKVLGSSSTYLPGRFGGIDGRALRKEDELSIEEGRSYFRPVELSKNMVADYKTHSAVRVVLGPQDDFFSDSEIQRFLSSKYTVTSESDRMGYRLDGAEIKKLEKREIVSDGVAIGAIQIPGDGRPIVMMADHQTTGGYPKIANVISVDLPIVAQSIPGDELCFKKTDVEKAQELRLNAEKRLEDLQKLLSLEFEGKRYIVKVNGKEFNVTIKEI